MPVQQRCWTGAVSVLSGNNVAGAAVPFDRKAVFEWARYLRTGEASLFEWAPSLCLNGQGV
eukprot:364478-Chlamydomonas_euryale.AAC.19